MPKGKTGERPTLNGIETSGNYPVEYKFAHAKNGNRHLVVVFANFSAPDEYGWSNGVFDTLRSNVLWIRDLFDTKNSYYLCKGMDFSLENSVIALISNVMGSLGLTPNDVTMWGGSKGGSAALHFGLKYGFRNIVSVVPQFRIGTYVLSIPSVAEFMMGEVTDGNVGILDSILPDLVRQGANRGANIYMLSSPQDEQYADQIGPFLPLFDGYANFNFIFSESPLITGHTDVTRRNVPLLMGILNFLIDGLAPRLGFVRNGYEQPDVDKTGINNYLAATSKVQLSFPAPVVSVPTAGQQVPGGAVTFMGSAPGAERVSLWENGKFIASPDVAADGSWTWSPARPWGMGQHVVRLFAVNAAGQHSGRTEVAFDVVEGTLQPTFTMPSQGQHVQGPVVGFMGFAPGSVHVEFWERGVSLGVSGVAVDGSWGWDSGWAWNEGEHVVEAVAVDATGNKTSPAAVAFTVVNAYAEPAPQGYFSPRF
ncbi:hypothetical protein [Streptomyces beijiangensis]|uniref:Bacterial Ig-like domain-containing protein n=1 Tax=Streptomyces beijiangensis TaxID=163361 RepID=A0A939JIC1_9ACTN|nr:hypothetical protein [Streptomyces beijiangensis]MBO0513542.1 hypothetical protein [Streptomyces beijiangensis]